MNTCQVRGVRLSRMTLGTAQLGLPYGIANRTGRPSVSSAQAVLELAWEGGVGVFDTAPAYGDIEEILGSFLASVVGGHTDDFPVVVTKVPESCFEGCASFTAFHRHVRASVTQSAGRLGLTQIPICLLHGGAGIVAFHGWAVESLTRLKEEGLVRLIGASVDGPCEVEDFLGIEAFDAIQLPVNVFDQVAIKSGLLDELARREVAVLARSVFLQGLFFLHPDRLPPYLQQAQNPLRCLRRIASECGRSIGELALTYVRDLSNVSTVVLGVETVGQLRDNLRLFAMPPLSDETRVRIHECFQGVPETLLRPSLWGSHCN